MLNTPSWRIAIFIMLFGISANGQTIQQQVATQIFKTDSSITNKTGAKSISPAGVGASDTSILHILLNVWNASLLRDDSGITHITPLTFNDSILAIKTLLALYQPLIPYTPENVANKVTTLSSPNNTDYPTSALLNTIYGNSLFATADSVLGRQKYSDTLTFDVTLAHLNVILAGYLKTEVDPVFTASPAYGISNGNITNWNTAYNKYVTGIGFSGGTLTLTKNDATTLTQSLDGRYQFFSDTSTYDVTIAHLNLILGSYALASTTLAGYGITDAYTKTVSDGRYIHYTDTPSLIYTKYDVDTAKVSIRGFSYSKAASDGVYARSVTLTTSGILYTSPVTFINTSGSFSGALSLITQSANMVFAGATSGGSATPGFRALVAADIPDLSATYTPLSTFNSQTGTTYTLVAADRGKVVSFNNSSAITLTIPASLGSTFYCTIQQNGTGQITFTASGTTLRVFNAYTKTAGQYAEVSIIFTPTADTYILQGLMQ